MGRVVVPLLLPSPLTPLTTTMVLLAVLLLAPLAVMATLAQVTLTALAVRLLALLSALLAAWLVLMLVLLASAAVLPASPHVDFDGLLGRNGTMECGCSRIIVLALAFSPLATPSWVWGACTPPPRGRRLR